LLNVNKEETNERTRNTLTKDPTLVWAMTGGEEERTKQTRMETEETSDEGETSGKVQKIEGNLLVLLQVNCRSTLSKSSEFWNLIRHY
jgi:hypothetical protein